MSISDKVYLGRRQGQPDYVPEQYMRDAPSPRPDLRFERSDSDSDETHQLHAHEAVLHWRGLDANNESRIAA